MAIVQVQAPGGAAVTTVTTASVNWPAPTTAGNLLLAVLQTRFNAFDIVPPTGMTLVAEQTTDTDERIWIYYEEDCEARSGAQTFTWTTASDATMHIIEYSGIATASSLDLTATDTQSSGDPSSGTTTTTNQDDELWFAAICNRNIGVQGSPTNGFAQVDRVHTANANAGWQLEGAIYEAIVSATGAAETSVTLTPGDNRPWAGLIVTLKADVGNADVTTTTVAGSVSVPTPSVSVTGDAEVTPNTVSATASMDAVTVTGDAGVALTTVAAAVSIPTPTVYPPTSEELIVDHTSPGGLIIDPRQRRFMFARPPFVLPSRDP